MQHSHSQHDFWNRCLEEAVAFRRQLHRRPELGWAEHATAAAIRERLDELGIPWRACAGTGTMADLAVRAPGPRVALRGDMDALPMQEETGLDWASETPGHMHACGHDGHTATLMATAAWLKRHESELPGPVRLLFQPAEEGGHGAKHMIEDGALEGVDAIYGWHNWPAIEYGKAVCPEGPVMAGNGTFHIRLKGLGGHSSQPELCRDPILAGAAVVMALQQIVARRRAPQKALVLSVCSFDAHSGPTIIPDTALIEGSFRISDPADRPWLADLIREIAIDTARGYGVEATVDIESRYEATRNHPTEAERYREALVDEFGPDGLCSATAVPIMASEDFSYFLDACPGAFALIGANDGRPHHARPCHSVDYDFNDALIARVVRVYARLVGAPLPPAAPD